MNYRHRCQSPKTKFKPKLSLTLIIYKDIYPLWCNFISELNSQVDGIVINYLPPINLPIKITIQFCSHLPQGKIWSKGKDALRIGFQSRNLVKRLCQVPKLKERFSWVGEKEVKKKRSLYFLGKGQDLRIMQARTRDILAKGLWRGFECPRAKWKQNSHPQMAHSSLEGAPSLIKAQSPAAMQGLSAPRAKMWPLVNRLALPRRSDAFVCPVTHSLSHSL